MAASFSKVAVIGSGVMGRGIAAHVANAGVPVLLLDIVQKGADDRSVLARSALEWMRTAAPSPLMVPERADLITIGNLEDDLAQIKDADWIIEAVLEDPKVKSSLYTSIDVARKPGSIVSSNTSTITLTALLEGQSAAFRRDFLITHFFNPPRQMRLLELVSGPETRANVVDVVRDFCDRRLGKGVVNCKDTPGFIANRLGIFFLQAAVKAAFELGVTIEEADAVFGKPFGMPGTGVFGLLDLIGIDLIPHIAASFTTSLPTDDVYHSVNISHPLVTKMIVEGFTGRKGKGGFYRIARTKNGKAMEAIDLATGEYHLAKKAKLATIENAGNDLRAICESSEKCGLFAWRVISQVLSYAASLVPQIANDIVSVDTAMRLGFNWTWGPFELIDKLGAAWFAARLQAEGRSLPPLLAFAADASFYRHDDAHLAFMSPQGMFNSVERSDGILLLADVKRGSTSLLENGAASLWDIGDGVVCLEFHTKMNTVSPELLTLLQQAITYVRESSGRYKAMVIHNESSVFSAGANLAAIKTAIDAGDDALLKAYLRQGQEAYQALRFAPFPIVAAPVGLALGGGCELLLHCSAVQSYAEAGMGLVETTVGLVPGWGGCTQMLVRALRSGENQDILSVARVFETIILAKTAKTPFEARALGYLSETDGITMNRDRLLYDAKQRALDLAKNHRPPEHEALKIPLTEGCAARELIFETLNRLDKTAPHDTMIGQVLASVLCGEVADDSIPVTEAQLLGLERRAFLKLANTPQTQARIDHMLRTGKPLRN